jgi:DNA invertase Pin-like site-specific DNA recombinase
MGKPGTPAGLAYSYKRYSDPSQGDGDSIRRQTADARAWCEKNGATLDTTTTIEDRGISAFRGKNRETGKLAAFLADVEAGRIPRGSTLLIENMDRLSREKPVRAVNVLSSILLAGIRVVQLKPYELELTEDSDLFSLFRGQMEQGRGHSESEMKSGRVSEAWGGRREAARGESRQPLSAKCPAWLRVVGQRREGKHVRGGSYEEIPERVAVVRRAFDMAAAGYGLFFIVKALTAEKVPTWGRGESWSKAYLHKILTGKAVLGFHQPIKNGEPDGEPLKCYPAVIDEDTWHRAQDGLARRKGKQGAVGVKVASLFGGLLYQAGTDERVLTAGQTTGPLSGKRNRARSRRRVLVTAGSMEGRGPSVSFPAEVFENEVLRWLKEARTADVLGEQAKESDGDRLQKELSAVRARRRIIEEELTGDGEDVPGLARVFKTLADRERDLARELALAKQRESNPRGAAWTEAKTLLDVAKDEASRLRLRDLLRQLIDRVSVLVVPRASHRLCAVQIDFASGARRPYLIHYRSAGYCREGGARSRSLKDFADVPLPDALDLRRPEDAEALTRLLESLDLGELWERLGADC